MAKKQVVASLDTDSGEIDILHDFIPRTKRKRTGKFILFYGENFIEMNKLTHGGIQIIMGMGDGNVLIPSAHFLSAISKKYEIPLRTLERNLRELQTNKIIVREHTGVYMVSPYLFIRGNTGGIGALISKWNRLCLEQKELDDAKERAKKDAEIERLKFEVGGAKILNKIDNILNGDGNV